MSQSPFGTPASAAVPSPVQPAEAENAVGGGRQRLLLLGGAGIAGLVVAGGLAFVLLTGGDAPADESAAPPLPAAAAAPVEAPVDEPVGLPTDVQFNDRNPFHADVVQSSGGAGTTGAGSTETTGTETTGTETTGTGTTDTTGTATSAGTPGSTTTDGTVSGGTDPVPGLVGAGGTGVAGPSGPPGPAGRDGVNGTVGTNGTNGTNGRDGKDGEDAARPIALTFLAFDTTDPAHVRARFALDYGTEQEVLVTVPVGATLESDPTLPGNRVTYVGASTADADNAKVQLGGDEFTLAPNRPRLFPGA